MSTERKLARIRTARIFIEDHGILTSYLDLEYAEPGRKIGGMGQGFGGYGLSNEYASKWIRGVLDAVGVDDWSKVAGKMVWVDSEQAEAHRIIGVDTGIEFDPTKWRDEAAA